MYKYILKRLLMLIPVIIGVSFIIFISMELSAGDPVLMIAGEEASVEVIEKLRVEYGYDRSVFYRFGKYMLNLVQGDLGNSYRYKAPVWDMYMERLPATAVLALTSVVFCHILSIPLGILAAVKRGSLVDNGATVVSLVGQSMPNFWQGILLIIWLSLNNRIFPSYGFNDGWKSLVLPALTISTSQMALLTRTTRSSMVDVLGQDYLRTARSKGAGEGKVVLKHALKNALIPIITISGTQLASILGGSVLVETVFAWPGVGRLMIDAINQRDVNLACGCIVMTTILTSIILVLIDVAYAFVDPRIKAQYTKGGKKK
jgi:peptide/nickel transport system permease protein